MQFFLSRIKKLSVMSIISIFIAGIVEQLLFVQAIKECVLIFVHTVVCVMSGI